MTVVLLDVPEHYWELMPGREGEVRVAEPEATSLDFVHLFITERGGLVERLSELRKRLAPTGMIWVSWPKGTSKVKTDVTEDVIRAAALQARLVDVKVCAVDATWSGLKLVIRKADRR